MHEGRVQIKSDYDEKVGKLNQDLNIKRSKLINGSRLTKYKERNQCLLEIKDLMVARLQKTMKTERKRYLETVKNLILQGMIKLIEPTLQIKCRRDDVQDIKGMCKDLESKYSSFMHEQTGRDEYSCTLKVLEDNFMTEEQDRGCGGVMLYTENSRIVCANTLYSRLNLAYEEMLPVIRAELFPEM